MIGKYIKQFKNHEGAQRYTRNISWMVFARMFTLGVSFLTTLYVARTLGPTNFGELDYALAIIGMFGIIAAWGIEGVLNRELIKHPEQQNELLGTALLLRLLLGALATMLVIGFTFFSHVDTISKILLVIISVTYSVGSLGLLQQAFLARAESKYPSIISVVVVLFTNALKVAILVSGKGIIYLALAMVAESILTTMLYLIAYKRVLKGKLTDWKISYQLARVFLKTGGAVAFLAVFSMIYSRIDQIMIHDMLDATSVGLYSAGVRLVDVWGFIPTIISTGLYPAILNARKISEELYIQRQRNIFLLYAVPAFVIAALVSFAAKPLMAMIFGQEFVEGFHALQIYTWSLPGTFIGFFVMNILFTDDHRKVLIFTAGFPAVINVILNFFWIPAYGIVGAAWATTISYSLIPLMPLLFKRTRAVLYRIYKS
jgi:O-antigen/teichoic acid export membrane protein